MIPDLTAFPDPVTSSEKENTINLLRHADPKDILADLELELKGVYKDEKGELIKKYEPYMNDKGISDTIKLVRSRVNRITNTSNFTEEEINNSILRLVRSLTILYAINWQKYEISRVQRTPIIDVIVSFAEAALNQSKNHKGVAPLSIIRALTTSTKRNEMSSIKEDETAERERGGFSLFRRK